MIRSIAKTLFAALLTIPAVSGPASSGVLVDAFTEARQVTAGARSSAPSFDSGAFTAKEPLRFAAGRPSFATIKGTVNNSPVDIRLDRRAWTITGAMNNSAVDIKIDHKAATIKGGANNSPVDLSFDWSSEKVVITGGANNSEVMLIVDFRTVSIGGHVTQSPVEIYYDKDSGAFRGHAGRAPVRLNYDKKTGRMTGVMNNAPVDMTLTNMPLGDFLQYFFLFVR